MNRTELRQKLVKRFNLEGLRTLCYDLHVDFENLGGEGKESKARELVLYMERYDRVDELVAVVTSPPPAKVSPADTYHLVDIRIFASERDEYPVELTVKGEGEFLNKRLRLDTSALRNPGSENYGRALGEALFDERAIGDAFRQTVAVFQSKREKVRLRLQLDSPALHEVRWEGIYHPTAGTWRPLAISAGILLSRFIPAPTWGRPDPLTTRPLRALVILASPSDLEQAGFAKISASELAAWHAVFDDQPHIVPTYLESETAHPPTLRRVQGALMDGYQIVHFVCHGKKTPRGTALLLEDENGEVERLYPARLLTTFDALPTKPHLCFLAACDSGAFGRTADFTPLGPTLVAEGSVPAVVAMADQVSPITIREFGGQFYDRVLEHGVVDLAMHQARLTVHGQPDWSVPVLFSRLPDNQLFGPCATSGGPGRNSRPNPPLPAPPAPNPFGGTGRIADHERFFDREELLRQIFEELNKGCNLSLVGGSQVGKSSLLSMVCALGPGRMNLPPEAFAYLNLEWVDDEHDFYKALCEGLAVETCRGYQLTRALRGKRHVLCLDEIEKMAWDGFTVRVRSQLRGLADGPTAPLRLVIASRSPLHRLFPDSPELDSPLAGICHQLDVGPFPPETAHAFLAHHLQNTNVTFTEREITTLIAQTNGHPARLQRAAADLYDEKRNTQHESRNTIGGKS